MKRIVTRVLTVAVLLAVAACMMVIGRGHTIYFDNKTLETDSARYEAVRRINVFVDGEQVAKLSSKERGMATCMGQKFAFSLEVIREKGGASEYYDFSLSLPYGMDGIVVNLPAIIEGAPEEVWMSQFVPAVVEPTEEDAAIEGTDEFGMEGMEGLEG